MYRKLLNSFIFIEKYKRKRSKAKVAVAILFFLRFPHRNRVKLINESKYQPYFRVYCSIRILLFSVSTTLGINISLNCILLAFAYGSTRYFVRTSVPKFCVSLLFQNLFTN